MGSPNAFWLLFGVMLVLIEFVFPRISIIHFGISALILYFISFFTVFSLEIQSLILIVCYGLSYCLLGKYTDNMVNKINKARKENIKQNKITEEIAIVEKDIVPPYRGSILYKGKYYPAEAPEVIPKGTHVKITNKTGNLFQVEKT
ncbi:NfeD family protein [Candidatus Margulisiibacteriota bacterium]